jgi:adenylosuccinate lyase
VPFIHFGLTSQDINNCAITSSLKDFIYKIYIPHLLNIITIINLKAKQWKLIRMLAHTHGQPAVPTTLGKEFKVYSYRLEKQLKLLEEIKYYGKFGGAVGNLNAHYFAFPERNWTEDLAQFLQKDLGLCRERFTTQIDNYENLAVLFDCLRRINTIMIDFDKDLWHYISLNYLKQSININEVGSSTMPQKVNPINFENSEGNLLLANSLLDFMSNKLPVSRLQRDLVDSTVLRNIGTIFGHIEIGFQSFEIGFSKIYPDEVTISSDLNKDMSILTEGIQVELRKQGIQNAYELNKQLARTNTKLSKPQLIEFIQNLDCIDQACKEKLMTISTDNYIGNAASFIN